MVRRTGLEALAVAGVIAITTACAKERPVQEPDSTQTKDRFEVTRTVQGPAGRLHVREEGEGGTPILFVHGFAGSSDQWSGQLVYFGGSRRVLAIDLRGHGASEDPKGGDYSVAGLAADIEAVADSLGLRRLALVGHSLGGAAAIEYAGRHPDRVAALVLIGAPGRTPPERGRRLVATMEADYERVAEGYWERLLTGAQPDVRSRVLADRRRVTREAGLAMIRAIAENDPEPALARYRGPTLLITTTVEDEPGDLAALRPDLPRQTITGTSHWPQMDNPAEINRLLDEFLATVP